jgi:hypothetical protein
MSGVPAKSEGKATNGTTPTAAAPAKAPAKGAAEPKKPKKEPRMYALVRLSLSHSLTLTAPYQCNK